MAGRHLKNYSRSYNYKLVKRDICESLALNEIDALLTKKQCIDLETNIIEVDKNVLNCNDISALNNIENLSNNLQLDINPHLPFKQTTINIEIEKSNQDDSVNYINDEDFVYEECVQETSEDSCEDESKVITQTSENFIRTWSLKNNITHLALSELLKWLSESPNLKTLPKDARTLLKTPNLIEIEAQGTGEFCYLGISSKLQKITLKYNITEFLLDFNIDGMPLHKSTRLSFWPILCKISNLVTDENIVFTVAVYCGVEKPPLEKYLAKFIEELYFLQLNGLSVMDRKIPINVRSFCVDAPARAFIKHTKGHNGFHGCDKCCCVGEFQDRRMQFIDLKAPLRTDTGFRSKIDEGHHKGDTPLLQLKIDLVDEFPVDYMHCVCLGVMRKLLFQWRDGARQFGISKANISALNTALFELKIYWPSEFNRKPRSLVELERWKATEFQQFLLYVGPLLLQKFLPMRMYKNFMLLKFGITILLAPHLNKDHNVLANKLLHAFVTHAMRIYGRSFCTYNTHGLIHLAKDAENFGSLNAITCFPFENYLQSLKNLLRKSNKPLQQVIRRLEEQDVADYGCGIKKEYTKFDLLGPLFPQEPCSFDLGSCNLFKKLKYKDLIFSNRTGDNCVQFDTGEIAIIIHFAEVIESKTVFIICQELKMINSFVKYPLDSKIISMVTVNYCNNNNVIYRSIRQIVGKGILLPLDKNDPKHFCYTPLVHTLKLDL